MNLNVLAKDVHQNAINHGWWEKEREFGSLVALMHSELSEALEEHRNGHEPTETYFPCENNDCRNNYEGNCYKNVDAYKTTCDIILKPEGIPAELADVIIRILDYCGKEGIDIEEAIRIKHEYNKTRPYRHGGKVI